MRNRDEIINAALDQSLLAIQDIEDGNDADALVRAQVAIVLTTLGTSRQGGAVMTAEQWFQAIADLDPPAEPERSEEEIAMAQALEELELAQYLAQQEEAPPPTTPAPPARERRGRGIATG